MKLPNFQKESDENLIYEVIDLRFLSDSTFILTFPKFKNDFTPGQHITVTLMEEQVGREYSIYSARNADYLEILIKEVDDGFLTPRLKFLKKGDKVKIKGPTGRFCFDDSKEKSHKHVFIASGTGIAPLHSMIKSYENIDYTVIQGVRYVTEECDRSEYQKGKFTLCTSRDNKGEIHGRLTEYLKQIDFEKNTSSSFSYITAYKSSMTIHCSSMILVHCT